MNKVMKFHADWCGPCKNYSPIFEQVTKSLKGWEVEEYNIETIRGTETSVTYGINSVPSTVIVVDGKEPRKLVGALSAADLAKELV